jgi:hypothetical protein
LSATDRTVQPPFGFVELPARFWAVVEEPFGRPVEPRNCVERHGNKVGAFALTPSNF